MFFVFYWYANDIWLSLDGQKAYETSDIVPMTFLKFWMLHICPDYSIGVEEAEFELIRPSKVFR